MRRHRDGYAPDGEFADGDRVVRAGGYIKAGNEWYQHDDLLPLVGQMVWVYVPDYWATELVVVDLDNPNVILCRAPMRKRQPAAHPAK